VPIAIKDNVDVAGEATRDGSRATSASPRGSDHPVVARLRGAGAVVVGKTRVPELCVFGATDSAFGVTRNPQDLRRTPGGSSGGSAAAVAAGMVPVAHANDGMGSIRIPAACCGVVGIKPGCGAVPAQLGVSSWYGLAENGVLSTTVADAALVLAVMAQRDDLSQLDAVQGPLRIAVATNPPQLGLHVDRDSAAAALHAGALLSGAGHRVEHRSLPYSLRATLDAVGMWTAGADDDAELLDRALLQRSVRGHAAMGRLLKRRQWVDAAGARRRWRERLKPFFDDFDAVLTPSLARAPLRAVRWGERPWVVNLVANAMFAPFQQPWNLAGYPAMSVPVGLRSRGLALSVQLVMREGDERRLLSLGAQLEALTPNRKRPALAR
jgi:amidase